LTAPRRSESLLQYCARVASNSSSSSPGQW